MKAWNAALHFFQQSKTKVAFFESLFVLTTVYPALTTATPSNWLSPREILNVLRGTDATVVVYYS